MKDKEQSGPFGSRAAFPPASPPAPGAAVGQLRPFRALGPLRTRSAPAPRRRRRAASRGGD